ncbi:MAG TPA: heavy metal translocating P-type ATPase [Steroidobacteraceae bacterium]|nr:heavy metal translocating P-type ATPase [Steroidobacteraceae bacterium]
MGALDRVVVMSATHAGVIHGLAARQCAHCRLPLPSRPHRETVGPDVLLFCCVGCVLVFRVIGSSGEGGRADWFLAKLGLAALLSGNIMMFQSLTYFGTLDALGPQVVRTSSWIMFFCSLAVFALLGVPMLRIALSGLFRGRLTLETLIGFGALAAIGFSAAQTLRGGHHLYYDSGTMVLVFVTLGQYLDAESRRRALALLSPTMSRTRRRARLFREGAEVLVSPASVASGEIVHVRAGEEIPVDGTVAAGSADVTEPLLTGEWRPRCVAAGDPVNAGSTAVDGALQIRAGGSAETLADRVARFALDARDHRAPTEAAVDRVVAMFIPAVALLAIGSCCWWGLAGEWERGFQAALAVLVVACPCALGIATPMATTIALSIATGRGSLVRSGAVLETLSRLRVVAFDKTGTITAGRPRIVDYRRPPGGIPEAESLRLAAGVEREVSHPFARAVVDAVLARGQSVPAVADVHVWAGGGVRGCVEGRRVAVGKRSWLAAGGVELPAASAADSESGAAIAIDGFLAGELVFDDPLRPEALDTMRTLGRMGVSCHLLSGDRREVVARVAGTVGVTEFAGELSPIEKPLRVRALRTLGPVAMVGDGVNDAPALGAADAGIAFGPAADLAKETADVVILRGDLLEIPGLLGLARRTMRIVRQNLVWAFAYNAVALVIAACGLLRPVVAAAAMVLSSVCVVHNSMRLSRAERSRTLKKREIRP